MSNALVIVESPTKARTIANFLPKGYTVMSSMGHVRDLPSSADEIPAEYKKEKWATLGVDYANGFEPIYIVSKGKAKIVKELKAALKNADQLLLATDEDREGESISWHLLELLNPKVPVKRMVFHEITKEAIEAAITNCRDVDDRLVRAQETRRILDRLVVYTVSPLLWKKIGGQLSAGRVQSVAVKLLVDRERERRAFRKGSYWDLKAKLDQKGEAFDAILVRLAGKRLAIGKDFDENTGKIKAGADVVLLGADEATALKAKLQHAAWQITDIEETPQSRRPSPPFITSTLQQEANRKLNLSARDAMRVAQDLYQRGFITYMRTDSVNLSQQAIDAAREWVQTMYGPEYLSPKPRQFATTSKGAQEAHEAIRPAGQHFRAPQDTGLTGMELRLYELIWKRTVASQMAESKQTNIAVTIKADDAEFRASGKRIDFPGFFRAYVEGSDDPDAAIEGQEVNLPAMQKGDIPQCQAIDAIGHETQPPARYTEASLVKALEADGVGRPSTYASIIGTIIERGYCRVDKKALLPTLRAFAVTQLLERHFPDLVDVGFTAAMEEKLDGIAEGKVEWLPYLEQFYNGDKGLNQAVQQREADIDTEKARVIALDGIAAGQIRVGRFGPYVETKVGDETVTANLPDDVVPGDISDDDLKRILEQSAKGPEPLGTHPETGEQIFMLSGRFGPYVQLGETPEDKKKKPKRASLLKGMTPETVDLKTALALLSLPRALGNHPEGGSVDAAAGRFGPYVAHTKPDKTKEFRSLKAEDNVLTVTLERALGLLAQPKGTRRGAAKTTTALKDLGAHPDDGQPVRVLDGRYGPYVNHGNINATLPKDQKVEDVTMDQAVNWLAEKAAKGPGKKKKAPARGKKKT